eukprot:2626695-Rhodomonas_salina.1
MECSATFRSAGWRAPAVISATVLRSVRYCCSVWRYGNSGTEIGLWAYGMHGTEKAYGGAVLTDFVELPSQLMEH